VTSLAERRAAFRRLHERGCFVVPNPWDAGTARVLAGLGFQALATTSAGLAYSRGLPDDPAALALGDVLEHVAQLVGAVDLPVTADFQAGYADTAEGVAANVLRCLETGVAGLSLEDATGDRDRPLYELAAAVERVAAARAAIDGAAVDVLLTARAECFLVGHDDPLRESTRRLAAYAAAGADVVYAPGIREPDEIRAVVDAAAGTPVNVLVAGDVGLTVDVLATLGVRRISVGSALSRAAWGAFLRAARELAQEGTFTGLAGAAPFAELNALFSQR
jgi:2-methylisocitrate lyase-like PEP mutase family enzyme